MCSGGGNKVNPNLNRGAEPLKWMMEQAKEQGLNVELHNVKVGMPNAEVTGSLGGVWWLLEVLPIQRRSYCTDGTPKMRRCEEFEIPFEAC
jgi:hypothetical protein